MCLDIPTIALKCCSTYLTGLSGQPRYHGIHLNASIRKDAYLIVRLSIINGSSRLNRPRAASFICSLSTSHFLCSSGPLSLWSSGRLVVWSSGRLVVWSSGRLVVWSSGRLVIWSSGRLVLWFCDSGFLY